MIKIHYLLFSLFLYSINLCSMIDNRFLPLYRRMYYRTICNPSSFGSNMFFLFASKSLDSDGKEIGLPEVNGKYDLISVTKALEEIGKNPPLTSQARVSAKLELDQEGKIGGQGAWLGYEQNICDNLYVGLSTYLMHLTSRDNFIIPDSARKELRLIKGSESQFDRDFRETNNLLGINSYQYTNTGVSDIDLYFRFGTIKDYFYKFRKVDLGGSLGVLIPAGPTIDINNPASIPFGGNGFWGLYGMIDLTLELKEDLFAGFWFELLKRFSKVQERRLSVQGEAPEFGALIGKVKIEPGLTVGFSPFIAFNDISEGLGFKFRYTLIFHSEDDWVDTCKERTFKVVNSEGNLENKIVRTRLGDISDKSEWSAEYLTFTLTYNFANDATKKCRKFAPIVYLEWDRPTKIFMAKNVAKTNRVSFGFEFNF